MNDILSEIIEHKREEIIKQKQAVSLEHLREQVSTITQSGVTADGSSCCRSMRHALATSATGIIAEFKRRSPSKGWIYESAQAETVPMDYETSGASVLSILTDEKFFGGSLRDLRTARPLVNIPILRKDFIIDEYQLLQARIVGADAVLLIAACLTRQECAELTSQAHALGLEVLLEVHTSAELSYINKEIDMVGVNNRNLGTFATDVNNSFRIAEELRQTVAQTLNNSDEDRLPLLVSESGISQAETLCNLRDAGFRGFLIGETFMKTQQPGNALKEFISQITRNS